MSHTIPYSNKTLHKMSEEDFSFKKEFQHAVGDCRENYKVME